MNKIVALAMTSAAVGYAGKEAPKMPEAPVTPPTTDAAPKVAPVVTGVVALSLTLPESTRRGGQPSAYPFDSLTEVGQYFGVKNRDKRGLSAAITNANRKGKSEITDPATGAVNKIVTKHFIAVEVTPEIAKQIEGTDLAGSTVLVTRDK